MSPAETIELRPVVTDADIDAYVDVRNRVEPADPITGSGFKASRLRRDHLGLLALRGGVPVGVGFVARNGEDPDSAYAFGKFGVLLAERRHGVGTCLFRALSEHARSFGREGLVIKTREGEQDSLSYLGKRRYQTVLRVQEVTLDVASSGVRGEPPPGIAVVSLTDVALNRPAYEAAVEIERDLPAVETLVTPPLDEWCARVFGDGVLRQGSFAAVADGVIVGFGFLYARPWGAVHGLTGVRRDWRRRGIARAIKCAQILAAKEFGVRELRALNEVGNAPIRQLNAMLGYRPLVAWLHLRGPLLVGAR